MRARGSEENQVRRGRTARASALLRVAAVVAALAAMSCDMHQQAGAASSGASAAVVSPADFPVMPPALRDKMLWRLRREVGGDPFPVAYQCYRALAAQAGGDALPRRDAAQP